MASVAEVQQMMKELQEESAKQMQLFMQNILDGMNKQKEGTATTGSKDKDPTDKDKGDKVLFDEKFMKRLKTFDGKQESWKALIFKFKNMIKLKNKDFWEVLNQTEKN